MHASGDIKTLSIVIPVYNELDTWRQILQTVASAPAGNLSRQIVIVDDCSTDGTREQLQEFAAERAAQAFGSVQPAEANIAYKVIFHPQNRGKGAALRTGFAAATGEVVIVQDADLEYDPGDYERLIGPIIAGEAAVVYGSRFTSGRPAQCLWSSYVANRVLTFLSNLTTGLGLSDMETCYKVFRRDVLGRLTLEQDRFGFEPEVTARVAALKVKLVELPISYAGRTRSGGKKIGLRDGLRAIWCILKYRPR